MIEVISATSPRFVDSDQSVIILNVQFSHLPNPVEFAASAHDTELHGRDIHARALAGEFGPVAEYVPPTPLEIATRDNPKLRRGEMAHATAMAQHYSMMGDQQFVSYWCGYYRLVYEMAQDPQWPLVSAWPTRPE